MTYKVIQWATGNVGHYALKATIENPDLGLVGVKVYNPAKAGMDAGDLCGMPATGVLATTSLEEIVALDADIVLHTPLGQPTPDEQDADVMALLRSGKSVISSVGYADPYCHGAEYAQMLHAAAVEGGVTLYGGGLSPELIISRIPAQLTQMCTDVKQIRLTPARSRVRAHDGTRVGHGGHRYGRGIRQEGHHRQEDRGYCATAGALVRAIPAITAADPGIFQAPVFAPWTPRMAVLDRAGA
jgi:hypothetical protein